MSNGFISNSFQVPNAVIDELMDEMSGSELKSYLLYLRHSGNVPAELIAKLGLQDRYQRTIYVLNRRGIL